MYLKKRQPPPPALDLRQTLNLLWIEDLYASKLSTFEGGGGVGKLFLAVLKKLDIFLPPPALTANKV